MNDLAGPLWEEAFAVLESALLGADEETAAVIRRGLAAGPGTDAWAAAVMAVYS